MCRLLEEHRRLEPEELLHRLLGSSRLVSKRRSHTQEGTWDDEPDGGGIEDV